MNELRLEQLAKEAGLVQGPWADGRKERIWQENRGFPDALEVFTALVAKECIGLIKEEIRLQAKHGIHTNTLGLNQAIFAIKDHFSVDT